MKPNAGILFILLSLYMHSCSQRNFDNKVLIDMMNTEIEIVEKLYEGCLLVPCYGDSIYYKNWLDGLLCEKNNEHNSAREFYMKAYIYDRFELSSYDIEFSLGRIEIKMGNSEKGKEYLKKYISNANNDLSNEYPMWGFTEEGEKELKMKIEYAEKLINKQ